MILCIQNQQLLPATPIYTLEAVNVILYIYIYIYIRICTEQISEKKCNSIYTICLYFPIEVDMGKLCILMVQLNHVNKFKSSELAPLE
jgi:hypothetical protein